MTPIQHIHAFFKCNVTRIDLRCTPYFIVTVNGTADHQRKKDISETNMRSFTQN